VTRYLLRGFVAIYSAALLYFSKHREWSSGEPAGAPSQPSGTLHRPLRLRKSARPSRMGWEGDAPRVMGRQALIASCRAFSYIAFSCRGERVPRYTPYPPDFHRWGRMEHIGDWMKLPNLDPEMDKSLKQQTCLRAVGDRQCRVPRDRPADSRTCDHFAEVALMSDRASRMRLECCRMSDRRR
jgi:hypothetical protein